MTAPLWTLLPVALFFWLWGRSSGERAIMRQYAAIHRMNKTLDSHDFAPQALSKREEPW